MSEYTLRVIEVVVAGLYPAKVLDVTQEEGQWGPYLKFIFGLQSGATVTGCCSAKFSTKSKLYKWTRAILLDGQPAPKGFVLRISALIGRYCELQVGVELDKDGDNFNVIEAIFPAQQAAAPASTVPEPPDGPPVDHHQEPPPIGW